MSLTATHSIALDFAYEEDTLDEALTTFVQEQAKLGNDIVETEVLDEYGPGGGSPIVKFTVRGDEEALRRFVVAYCDGDEAQAADLLTADVEA